MKETLSIQGFNVLKFDEIDSTNEEAKRLVRAGQEGDFAVWALSQRAGRGRYGRQWESPEGNLFVSLALQVDKTIQQAAQLSFVAALAVGDVLTGVLGDNSRVQYKWPNDVLVDGKKIAGILLESSAKAGSSVPDGVIVGMGLNIRSFPEQTIFPATCLHQVGVLTPEADVVREYLQMLIKSFTQWNNYWKDKGLLPVRERWLSQAWAKGKVIKADLGNIAYQGVFEGMTDTGELVLKEPDGCVRHISAGEIFFDNR